MSFRSLVRRYSSSTKLSRLRQQLRDGPGLEQFINQSTEAAKEDTIQSLVHQLQAHERSIPVDQLVDTFGRQHTYLRISLTERCNLRCQYCMPADGVPLQPQDNLLSTPEILHLARLFASCGITKIRLTGGEPLLRRDLVDLIFQLKQIPGIESIGITTNAITLPRQLDKLEQAGVDRLNISLDTLDDATFTRITRRKGLSRVLDSIHAVSKRPNLHAKVNCVVMRGVNDHELVDFVHLTQDLNVDVRFIEWMPFDQNAWEDTRFIAYSDMLATIQSHYPNITKVDDDDHATAKSYKVDDFTGQFGFISSMSKHFCGGCNRLRLTADGNLKVCLFGHNEVSLRDAIRHDMSDADVLTLVDAAVKRKKFALGGHGDMYGLQKAPNRPMVLIGG